MNQEAGGQGPRAGRRAAGTCMRRRPSATSEGSTVGDSRMRASDSASLTPLSSCRGVAVMTCARAAAPPLARSPVSRSGRRAHPEPEQQHARLSKDASSSGRPLLPSTALHK